MVTVEHIDVPDLERLVAVRNVLRPGDPANVADFEDWRRQAGDMAWLVAAEDGADVGAGIGLVGWHSKPGTATVEAWTLPHARGRGVGHALYAELLHWAAERACVEVQTSVSEDDPASLEWADKRGFREIGRELRVTLELAGIDAPEIDPPPGIEIVAVGRARRSWLAGCTTCSSRRARTSPARTASRCRATRSGCRTTCRVSGPSRGGVRRAVRGGRSGRVREAFAARRVDRHSLARPHRCEARVAWPRHRLGAQAGADPLGEGAGLPRLTTMNEERNAPIRHLNERYGYRPEPGRIVLSTALSGPD